jgi:DNA-binding transcriptional MerR regulator
MKTAEDVRKRYKTYEVCKLFNVSRATLFRWEREGLISGPPRDWRNWRIYTGQNINEITQIIRTKTSTD